MLPEIWEFVRGFEGDEPCLQVPGTVANVVKLLLVVRYSILLIGLNVDCM